VSITLLVLLFRSFFKIKNKY